MCTWRDVLYYNAICCAKHDQKFVDTKKSVQSKDKEYDLHNSDVIMEAHFYKWNNYISICLVTEFCVADAYAAAIRPFSV